VRGWKIQAQHSALARKTVEDSHRTLKSVTSPRIRSLWLEMEQTKALNAIEVGTYVSELLEYSHTDSQL
jgi:hypothetical protein